MYYLILKTQNTNIKTVQIQWECWWEICRY